MDYLQGYRSQFRNRLIVILIAASLVAIGAWWLVVSFVGLHGIKLAVAGGLALLLWLLVVAWLGTNYLIKPTKMIWQTIMHLAPGTTNVPMPKLDRVVFGRELIGSLTNQIYQLATTTASIDAHARKDSHDLHNDPIAANLPLPLFVLNKDRTVVFANEQAINYIGRSEAEITGKNVYSILDLSFHENFTLDRWLAEAPTKGVTAHYTWDRARLNRPEGHDPLFFDLAAYYNKANPYGYEILLVLFDHTKKYTESDKGLSFVAMAVHELRTPLTLLRGYIEALEESSEHRTANDVGLLQRMDASAHQLSDFVDNVLNVARVEDDQYVVQLHDESWPKIIQTAVNDMNLQAAVHGISIKTKIDSNLPTVGVDSVSAYEVLANLLGNAIKYSGSTGKEIIVDAHLTTSGLVETTIRDFGIGIPASVIPNLFNKYYRSHRSRTQIGGTGLGLYLCKNIVDAHGGNIWVRSKEGEGSMFGFTVLPYSKLSPENQRPPQKEELTRVAHGWIKNHSLFRR